MMSLAAFMMVFTMFSQFIYYPAAWPHAWKQGHARQIRSLSAFSDDIEQWAGIPCLASERFPVGIINLGFRGFIAHIYVRRIQSIIQFAGVRVNPGVPINNVAYDKFFSNHSFCCWLPVCMIFAWNHNHRRAVNIRSKTVYARGLGVNVQWESTLMWFHCLQWQWCQFCFQMVPVFLNRVDSCGHGEIGYSENGTGTVNE